MSHNEIRRVADIAVVMPSGPGLQAQPEETDHRHEEEADDKSQEDQAGRSANRRGVHSRSSQRASKACEQCRRRKARCDGKKPRCSGCARLGTQCVMPTIDLRKLPGDKKQAVIAQKRSKSVGQQVAATQHQSSGTSSAVGQSASRSPPVQFDPTNQKAVNASASPLAGSNTTSPFEVQTPASTSRSEISTLPVLASMASGESLYSGHHDAELAAAAVLVENDLRSSDVNGSFTPYDVRSRSLAAQITGLSGRMTISDGGLLRYYGPTSNRHLSLGATPLGENLVARDVNAACLEALIRAGEGTPIPDKLATQLLSLYFIWHNAFFYIVHQELFLEHRQRYLSGKPDHHYFTWTLYYAMLAYAASFSDSAVELAGNSPEKSGDIFLRRARICLDVELDSPTASTVAALAIIGSHEVCVGRDARGYIHHSMATAAAIDLGMHKDACDWLELGRLTSEQYRIRNLTWWGMYMYDRGWSVYVGRLPNANRDITTPHPHSSSDSHSSFSGTLVSLLRITDTIMVEFYSEKLFMPRGAQEGMAAECHEKLLEWHAGLPLSESIDLDLQPQPAAHVICLHLQYYATMLLLHRPRLGDVNSNAFEVCCSACSNITSLLQLYKRSYGFRRMCSIGVHQIFTAATTLIYVIHRTNEQPLSTASSHPTAQDARRQLLICLAALSALGGKHVHARRSYLSAVLLMKKWKVSLDVIEQGTAPENLPVHAPQSQQFEALSQQLFERSNDIMDVPPPPWQDLSFFPNPAAQQQPMASFTDPYGFGEGQHGLAADANTAEANLDEILNFFNVETTWDNASLPEWLGPSLQDIFEVNSASTGAAPFAPQTSSTAS